jgi:hypothetical protein
MLDANYVESTFTAHQQEIEALQAENASLTQQVQDLQSAGYATEMWVTDHWLNSVAIGNNAGQFTQGLNSVAIGNNAGQYLQGLNSVAIGNKAGEDLQGSNSVAIGNKAGEDLQHDNTIIINATGFSLNSTNPDRFYVRPIRDIFYPLGLPLYYDPVTGEITYSSSSW